MGLLLEIDVVKQVDFANDNSDDVINNKLAPALAFMTGRMLFISVVSRHSAGKMKALIEDEMKTLFWQNPVEVSEDMYTAAKHHVFFHRI